MAKGTGRRAREAVLSELEESDPERYAALVELRSTNPQAFRKAVFDSAKTLDRKQRGRGAKLAPSLPRRGRRLATPKAEYDEDGLNEIMRRAYAALEEEKHRSYGVEEVVVDVRQMEIGSSAPKKRAPSSNGLAPPGRPAPRAARPSREPMAVSRPAAPTDNLAVLEGSVGAIKSAVDGGGIDAHLEALLDAERAGRARKGVLSALEKRLATLG